METLANLNNKSLKRQINQRILLTASKKGGE